MIKSFTDLRAWKEGHELVLLVYKTLHQYPKYEMFCLSDQSRRAVISVTSNIAEGFSRKSSKEKRQFYYIALGSLTELQNQLIVAKDLGYFDQLKWRELINKTLIVKKLLFGLLKTAP